VKELRHIFFNVGPEGVGAARAFLAEYTLADQAEIVGDGLLAGNCHVTLPATDVRLDRLCQEIQARFEQSPLVRAERIYSDRELDAREWLLLRVGTAGLMGGINMGQPYDHSHACGECGAGAVPMAPLLADLARMGKKQLDRTAHDGHIVVSQRLAGRIQALGLTGVEINPVQRQRGKEPDSAYRWLRITAEWPPLSAGARIHRARMCPRCGRSGHFDLSEQVTELRYAAVPATASDWNLTWEYFGEWQLPPGPPRRCVGGERWLIVSQRARTLLRDERVQGLGFDPIVVAAAS